MVTSLVAELNIIAVMFGSLKVLGPSPPRITLKCELLNSAPLGAGSGLQRIILEGDEIGVLALLRESGGLPLLRQ
jgi:hypothetical protein